MSDEVDNAQILEDIWQQNCLNKQKNKSKKQREYSKGDSTECEECGECITPKARLEAGYLTCIDCARELENKR